MRSLLWESIRTAIDAVALVAFITAVLVWSYGLGG
jgi:hypothetical protein